MPRIVPAKELDLIAWVISKHPDGIGISALEQALAHHLFRTLNRRTLQRLHEGSVARYRLKLSQFQVWAPIRKRYQQR